MKLLAFAFIISCLEGYSTILLNQFDLINSIIEVVSVILFCLFIYINFSTKITQGKILFNSFLVSIAHFASVLSSYYFYGIPAKLFESWIVNILSSILQIFSIYLLINIILYFKKRVENLKNKTVS
jgi:hypothetical protein